MRILYVTPFWPAQPSSASEVRSLAIADALREIGHVEVTVLRGVQGRDEGGHCATGDVSNVIEVAPISSRTALQKVAWVLDPRAPFPHGLSADPSGVRRIREAAAACDLVWFFKLRSANVFPCWTWPRSVVDIDDLPSQYEASIAATPVPLQGRVGAQLRRWSWSRREALLGERFDVLSVCSNEDRRHLVERGCRKPVHVIPNGFERPSAEPVRDLAHPPRIGFIGVFDHEPNVAGVRWFVEQCWPMIKRAVPDARLRLLGRLTDGPLRPAGPDVDGLGWVTDPSEEMSTWSAMIVPVHTGAGTRGKIAHALSQKCPVVSTRLGAYGYDLRDGDEIVLADTADAFATACTVTIRDTVAAAQRADRAWQKFLDRWTWEAIALQVRAAAESCLSSRPSVTPPGQGAARSDA